MSRAMTTTGLSSTSSVLFPEDRRGRDDSLLQKDSLHDKSNTFSTSSNQQGQEEEEKEGLTSYVGTEWLGRGSYGVVWAARNNNGDKIAVKKITDVNCGVIMAKRALREMKLLRLLKHGNVIDLKHVHVAENGRDLYVITELMDCNLDTVIKSDQSLTLEHCRFFVYQLLRGLLYIHSSNVVHRDLKPANLLVNKDCSLKICDFGLARLDDTTMGGNNTTVNMTGEVTSRWYRAPEVMLGWDRYTKAIDMWAVGCIAAELVMRTPLFRSKTAHEHMQAVLYCLGTLPESALHHITEEPVRAYVRKFPSVPAAPLASFFPSDTHPDFVDFVTKLLRVDPSQRLTAAEAIRHPFLSCLHFEADEPIAPPLQPERFFAFEAQGFLEVDDFMELIVEEATTTTATGIMQGGGGNEDDCSASLQQKQTPKNLQHHDDEEEEGGGGGETTRGRSMMVVAEGDEDEGCTTPHSARYSDCHTDVGVARRGDEEDKATDEDYGDTIQSAAMLW